MTSKTVTHWRIINSANEQQLAVYTDKASADAFAVMFRKAQVCTLRVEPFEVPASQSHAFDVIS